MNDKETELWKIVDIVVECCATPIDEEGTMSVTKEDVLGKSHEENVVMTRCILVQMISFAGYSTTTIAQLLHRTVPAIRHMMKKAQEFHMTKRAYRIAEAEATIKCKSLSQGL